MVCPESLRKDICEQRRSQSVKVRRSMRKYMKFWTVHPKLFKSSSDEVVNHTTNKALQIPENQ